jgi:hypothetical protein
MFPDIIVSGLTELEYLEKASTGIYIPAYVFFRNLLQFFIFMLAEKIEMSRQITSAVAKSANFHFSKVHFPTVQYF